MKNKWLIALPILVVVVLGCAFTVLAGVGGLYFLDKPFGQNFSSGPIPTVTAAIAALPTFTSTPIPTSTLPPTATPTQTPLPASATPSPTATGTPTPTATSSPQPTVPPTNTPVPATSTPLPSDTPSPSAPPYQFIVKESSKFETNHLNFDVYVAVVDDENRPLSDYRLIGTHSGGLQQESLPSAGDWTENSGAMHYKAGNIKYEAFNSPAGVWTLQLVDPAGLPAAAPVEFPFDPNQPTWYFVVFERQAK